MMARFVRQKKGPQLWLRSPDCFLLLERSEVDFATTPLVALYFLSREDVTGD